MLIFDEDPPIVEEPEPRFGEVINELNELSLFIEESTLAFNQEAEDLLLEIGGELGELTTVVPALINDHVSIVGPAHGETKHTVNLGLKDNFRTATVQEHIDNAPVDAFVTPLGAKQAVLANNALFNPNDYQHNNLLKIASYYLQEDLPTGSLSKLPRFFEPESRVEVFINADRLVVSPKDHPSISYGGSNSYFTSNPLISKKRPGFNENSSVTIDLKDSSFNSLAGFVLDGSGVPTDLSLFKPIADKSVYTFPIGHLARTGYQKAVSLFAGYGSSIFKGLCHYVKVTGSSIQIQKETFKLDGLDSNQTMSRVVPTTHPCRYELMGSTFFNGTMADAGHQYTLASLLTLPAGAVATFESDKPEIVSVWKVQDALLLTGYFFKVKIVLGSKTKFFLLRITESFNPGNLFSNGMSVVKTLGSFNKTVVDDTLNVVGSNERLIDFDITDANNPIGQSSSFKGDGGLITAAVTRNALIVKHPVLDDGSLVSWLEAPMSYTDVSGMSTQKVTPVRNSAFGDLPERVILVDNFDGDVKYLCYGLSGERSLSAWTLRKWKKDDLLVKTSGVHKFTPPIDVQEYSPERIPSGLVTTINPVTHAMTTSSLIFGTFNDFKAPKTFQFNNDVITLGGEVLLAPQSLATINSFIPPFLTRARAQSPTTAEYLRRAQAMVFKAPGVNRCILVLTDGLGYAEAVTGNYTETPLSFIPVFSEVLLTVVSNGKNSQVTGYRSSHSGDNVKLNFTDVVIKINPTNSFTVTINRPYGSLYGQLTFMSTTGGSISTNSNGTTHGVTYKRQAKIDVVNELYPPIPVLTKGVFTQDYDLAISGTSVINDMVEVTTGVTDLLSLFSFPSENTFSLPAGTKLLLGGRSYILERQLSVPFNDGVDQYIYLTTEGSGVRMLASPILRPVSNFEVIVADVTDGIKNVDKYIVLDGSLISTVRRGSTIPVFSEDGATGTTTYFKQSDVID